MTVMLLFMFKWQDHDSAPQLLNSLSLENVIMFGLATPVQVQIIRLILDKSSSLRILVTLIFVDHLWSIFLCQCISFFEAQIGKYGRSYCYGNDHCLYLFCNNHYCELYPQTG